MEPIVLEQEEESDDEDDVMMDDDEINHEEEIKEQISIVRRVTTNEPMSAQKTI